MSKCQQIPKRGHKNAGTVVVILIGINVLPFDLFGWLVAVELIWI